MTSRKAPRAPTKKRPTKHTPPPSRPNVRPPAPGPGRPRKPRAPRGEHQVALAEAIERAEAERDAAAVEYSTTATVAAEITMLRRELQVASTWAAYLRAGGNMTHALKFGELSVKLAGRLAGLREIEAADRLDKLMERAGREDALGRGR